MVEWAEGEVMSDEFVSLSFRAYLSQRRKRYGPGSEILAAWMRDDEFAAITSQQELDDYLARRKVGLNGQNYAYVVWKGYLAAKKRRRRAPIGDAADHPATNAPDRAGGVILRPTGTPQGSDFGIE